MTMLIVNDIKEKKEKVIEGLQKRGWSEDQLLILDEIILLDDRRKNTQTELDTLLSDVNRWSKEIGDLFKSGKSSEANAAKEKVAETKERVSQLESESKVIIAELEEKLVSIPNVPHESVPKGKSAEDNIIDQDWTEDFVELYPGAVPHWDLAKQYNLIDFELGAKITGAGFPLYRGKGAKLQRALISFFLDEAGAAGYEEIIPPLLVNEDSARATGQLPDKEGQMYYMERDDLYLIPTAEVPVTNIYRDVIMKESDFPIKMTGHTPCFRREAGSYGSDVKGLNRVHQFDKIEIVQIVHPARSYEVLQEMVDHVKQLLEKLELPYRILRLCGGDMGFTSALTFDFEVYSIAQKRWLEVSSVSNFETFQSNRLKLRYRDEDGKRHLAHTLNGSALALARIVAALLENNQTADGIKIPAALVPYTRFEMIN
jgi:seryl-tRNA synthetase